MCESDLFPIYVRKIPGEPEVTILIVNKHILTDKLF